MRGEEAPGANPCCAALIPSQAVFALGWKVVSPESRVMVSCGVRPLYIKASIAPLAEVLA